MLDNNNNEFNEEKIENIDDVLPKSENDIPEELPEELSSNEEDFVVDSSTHDLLSETPAKIEETESLLENEEEKQIMSALDEDEEEDSPTTEVFNSNQWDALDIQDSEFEHEEEPVSVEANPILITAEELNNARREAQDSESVTSNSAPETVDSIPEDLKKDVKSVLKYMDQLLENLPEDKIEEFARSEHFNVYKKLFTELGLV